MANLSLHPLYSGSTFILDVNNCQFTHKDHFLPDKKKITEQTWLYSSGPQWLRKIHTFYVYEDEPIGVVSAFYIDRELIRPTFRLLMSRVCKALGKIAVELFNKNGLLKAEYFEDEYRRGTYIWGNDLDTGPLIIICTPHVNPEWEEMGLGKLMIDNLLSEGSFVNPMPNCIIGTDWVTDNFHGWGTIHGYSTNAEMPLRVLRRAGFRRIGASSCLAFAITNPDHASHSISAEEDYNPPSKDQAWGLELEKQAYNLPRILKKFASDKAQGDFECIKFFLAHRLAISREQLKRMDSRSNNILHYAAFLCMPQVVIWILESLEKELRLDLIFGKNIDGYTPFTLLESRLKQIRYMQIVPRQNTATYEYRPDMFEGFQSHEILTYRRLKMEVHPSLDDHRMDCACRKCKNGLTYNQLKYGCTCNNCQNGWWSERMGKALLSAVQFRFSLEPFSGAQAKEPLNQYLASRGWLFHDIFHAIRVTLSGDHTKPPLRANIFNFLAWDNKSMSEKNQVPIYLKRINFVLRVIFSYARENSMTSRMRFALRSVTTPLCRNDTEFEFVAARCGVPDGIDILDSDFTPS